MQARLGNEVYLYCFEHFNPAGFGLAGLLFPFKGATHCSELPYLFGKGVISNFFPTSPDDVAMAECLTSLFTNFARTGRPFILSPMPCTVIDQQQEAAAVRWDPLSAENTLRYMAIGLKAMGMRENFRDGLLCEWRRWFDSGYMELDSKI